MHKHAAQAKVREDISFKELRGHRALHLSLKQGPLARTHVQEFGFFTSHRLTPKSAPQKVSPPVFSKTPPSQLMFSKGDV